MRFALIDTAKADFPIHRLCGVLGVSQSGYFAWRGRPACRRQRDDMVLLAHVRSAFALSNGTYGSPRITRELRDSGLTVGRRRTARLMRENRLRARQKRRFKRTTDSQHPWPVAPNLLDQDFAATGPDEKWGADISYVWTREGWLYLAVIICYSRSSSDAILLASHHQLRWVLCVVCGAWGAQVAQVCGVSASEIARLLGKA